MTSKRALQWYVYVYPYLAESDFEIYISGNERFGDFRYEFSLYIWGLRFRGW
jgi:hypothetical protein